MIKHRRKIENFIKKVKMHRFGVSVDETIYFDILSKEDVLIIDVCSMSITRCTRIIMKRDVIPITPYVIRDVKLYIRRELKRQFGSNKFMAIRQSAIRVAVHKKSLYVDFSYTHLLVVTSNNILFGLKYFGEIKQKQLTALCKHDVEMIVEHADLLKTGETKLIKRYIRNITNDPLVVMAETLTLERFIFLIDMICKYHDALFAYYDYGVVYKKPLYWEE